MIKGVIFDFNGTLFIDHEMNKYAWVKLLKEIGEGKIDPEAFYYEFSGINNYQTIKACFDRIGKSYTDELINKLAYQKEVYYQEYILKNNLIKKVEGEDEFFNYLKDHNIKMNLATSSIKYNCDFYFKYFNLTNWFDQSLISYDDGSYLNKKQMYLDAAKRIGLDIKECVIVEDSTFAIKNAIAVGCEKIIFLNSKNLNYKRKEIIQEIKNFTEVDLSIFA